MAEIALMLRKANTPSEQIYDDVVEETLSHLRVDARGVAAHSGWQMDLAALRNWLHKLRQACTHPQVRPRSRVPCLTNLPHTGWWSWKDRKDYR